MLPVRHGPSATIWHRPFFYSGGGGGDTGTTQIGQAASPTTGCSVIEHRPPKNRRWMNHVLQYGGSGYTGGGGSTGVTGVTQIEQSVVSFSVSGSISIEHRPVNLLLRESDHLRQLAGT